jgi:signal peptidase
MSVNKKVLTLSAVFSSALALFIGLGFLFIKFPDLPSRIAAARDYVAKIAPRPYVVYSGSMEPAIKTGSVILSIPTQNYLQGDIVTFSPSGSSKDLVTHRIALKKYPEGVDGNPSYLTAGDANEDYDNWEITNDNIIGKVVLTIPYVGYAADFAKKPQGFLLLVVVPATIVIYEELKSLRKELAKSLSGIFGKIFKKKSLINLLPPKSQGGLPKAWAIAPVLGAFLVILAFSAAYFFDVETSLANIFGAATSYGEKTAPLYDSDPYDCSLGATDTTIQQQKIVILEIDGGNVKATVVLDNATPNSSYDIWINQDPGGCPLTTPTETGAILTDLSGDGTGDASAPLVGGATNFWVSAVGGGQVLRSTAVTLP